MELDELDMAEGSTGSEISLQFNYDGMFLAPGMTVNENGTVGGSALRDYQLASGAQWPFHYEANNEFTDPEPEPGGALRGEEVENTGTSTAVTADESVASGPSSVAEQLATESGIRSEAAQGYLDEIAQKGQNAKTGIVNTVTGAARGAANAVAGAAAGLFGGGPRKL